MERGSSHCWIVNILEFPQAGLELGLYRSMLRDFALEFNIVFLELL